MNIGRISVRKGEKKTGFLKVEGCGDELPVTVICGGAGKTVLITAGVHNAEYVGIQAAIELSRELEPEMVRGTLLIVPVVNVSGFTRRTMSVVYEDGKNLNREFPGRPDGTPAERICHTLVRALFSRADYYVDLHSGDGYEDLYPYAYYVGPVEPQVRETSFQMARRAAVGYLVESSCVTGGAYNYASSLGIPSILLERGGRGIWSRPQVEQDKEDVRQILAYLGVLQMPGLTGEAAGDPLVFREAVYENAPENGCWYAFFRPGDRVPKGAVLGEIRDYFGQTIHVCRAKADGVILYQTASLTVLKDGPMVAYGILPV